VGIDRVSESSMSKTKRRIRDKIMHYQPEYKVSLVLPSLSVLDVKVLTIKLPDLKRRIARINNDSVVIFWLMSHYFRGEGVDTSTPFYV
jgi:hypothetical protein